jgi:hypothetical protein
MTDSDDSGIRLCEQCNVPMVSRSDREYCRDCADGESIPIAELEQLADEWDEKAQAETFSDYESGVNAGIELVVDELQELIADYTDE